MNMLHNIKFNKYAMPGCSQLGHDLVDILCPLKLCYGFDVLSRKINKYGTYRTPNKGITKA
jgi:hypothetical protein